MRPLLLLALGALLSPLEVGAQTCDVEATDVTCHQNGAPLTIGANCGTTTVNGGTVNVGNATNTVNIKGVRYGAARAWKRTDVFSINGATITMTAWVSDYDNSNGLFGLGADTATVYASVAGIYEVGYQIMTSVGAPANLYVETQLFVGSVSRGAQTYSYFSGDWPMQTAVALIPLSTGEANGVFLRVKSVGGALTFCDGANSPCRIWIKYVGPLT